MSTFSEQSPLEHHAHPVDAAPDRVSAYFFELECLLNRVESATTCYTTLAAERWDEQEKIKESFRQILDLLYPPYIIGKSIPSETDSRIGHAFTKVSEAFDTLASYAKRKEYDRSMFEMPEKTADLGRVTSRQITSARNELAADRVREAASASAATDNINLRPSAPRRGEVSTDSSDRNRRRCGRINGSIPARVTGHDRKSGAWHEMTETIDFSRTGVRLRLRRRVKHGMVLLLTLPLPTKLRAHGFTDQSYNVYTLVRRVEPPKQGVRAVGLEFLGERPPAGYLDKPWGVFRSRRWSGDERRRFPREERSERLRIEYLDDSMQSMGKEDVRTENVSRFGLRIVGTTAPSDFDVIAINCPSLKFEALAVTRNRYKGKDGRERLCLQLIDKEWPLSRSR